MNTLEIVVIVVLALLIVLALGGAIAQRRRMRAGEAQFRERVERANHDLAEAHAADNGWDPVRLDAAARAAFALRVPGEEITAVSLVQVVDRPGTERDEAVFVVETAARSERVTLGRDGDDWTPRD